MVEAFFQGSVAQVETFGMDKADILNPDKSQRLAQVGFLVIHAGTGMDHQEPYLRQALAFIGIQDVSFIHAEGLNLGDAALEKGLNHAKAQLAQVA